MYVYISQDAIDTELTALGDCQFLDVRYEQIPEMKTSRH